jgi:hypothetical protein
VVTGVAALGRRGCRGGEAANRTQTAPAAEVEVPELELLGVDRRRRRRRSRSPPRSGICTAASTPWTRWRGGGATLGPRDTTAGAGAGAAEEEAGEEAEAVEEAAAAEEGAEAEAWAEAGGREAAVCVNPSSSTTADEVAA